MGKTMKGVWYVAMCEPGACFVMAPVWRERIVRVAG